MGAILEVHLSRDTFTNMRSLKRDLIFVYIAMLRQQ